MRQQKEYMYYYQYKHTLYLDVVIATDKASIKESMLVKELIENKINKRDLQWKRET